MTAEPMTQHVVMTAERMTLRDDGGADDTTRCDDQQSWMTAKPMTAERMTKQVVMTAERMTTAWMTFFEG
jgi:hypothetical protein